MSKSKPAKSVVVKPVTRRASVPQVGAEKATSHVKVTVPHSERLYQGAVSYVFATKGRAPTFDEERNFAEQYAAASTMFRQKAIEHGAKPEWLDVPRKVRTKVLNLLLVEVKRLRKEPHQGTTYTIFQTLKDRVDADRFSTARSVLIEVGYGETPRRFQLVKVKPVNAWLCLNHASGRWSKEVRKACVIAADYLGTHGRTDRTVPSSNPCKR